MGERSKIEWTEATWTPIRARHRETGKIGWHCEHVSEGCRNCYAESINKRLGTGLPFKPGHLADVELFLDEKMLLAPLRWKRPRMVFACSMTDLFADFVPGAWIDRMFAVMALCPQHTFQVLTKRAKRMREYLSAPGAARRIYELACDLTLEFELLGGFCNFVLIAPGIDARQAPAGTKIYLDVWPLPNVWLGVSVEDQQTADARIPDLLATPAAVRFVSYEPALGPVDFRRWLLPEARVHMHGEPSPETAEALKALVKAAGRKLGCLDWIIAGGESGPHARPAHPDWFRQVRDQCKAAGVPFFMKQWGEWLPGSQAKHLDDNCLASLKATSNESNGVVAYCFRVGKKRAGRLLDGVEHNDVPEARA